MPKPTAKSGKPNLGRFMFACEEKREAEELLDSTDRRRFSSHKAVREREVPQGRGLSLAWPQHPIQKIHDRRSFRAVRNARWNHQPSERRDGVRAGAGRVHDGHFEIAT